MDRARVKRGAPRDAAVLLGFGLGGLIDGILLHEVLQWHNMLSNWIPPNDLISTKVNMVWDGLFNLTVWAVTVLGVVLLVRSGVPVGPGVGRWMLGWAIFGWGAFNITDSVANHYLLRTHDVFEYTTASGQAASNLLFLMLAGFGLCLFGVALTRSKRPTNAL